MDLDTQKIKSNKNMEKIKEERSREVSIIFPYELEENKN